MNYSSRFFLYAPLGLFLAIACAVGIHWWVMASRLGSWLDLHNGREVAPGVTMTFASRGITGFPFSLDTVFRSLSFRVVTPHGPTEWRPEEFAMHALTYGRDETIFEAAGKQELSWTKDDGSKRDLIFAVGSLHASAISDSGGLARFDLDLVGFGSKVFAAQRIQFHIRRNNGDMIDVIVTADDMRAPADAIPSDGLALLHLEGTANQAHTLDLLRAGNERWYDGLERWRAAKGHVRLASATYEVCGVRLTAQGQLTLDAAHRLVMGVSSEFEGQAKPDQLHAGKKKGGSATADTDLSKCPYTPIFYDFVTDGRLYLARPRTGPLY